MKDIRILRTESIVFLMVILWSGMAVSALPTDISFDKYHSHEEVTTYLKAVNKALPDFTRLSSMGKSFLGKEIWVLEISGRKDRFPEHKPAIYIDGGTHGNEVTGTEVCLHTIDYLVKNYGKDDQVTRLVDTRTFYIAPSVNPDANDLFVTSPLRSLRNNLRPYDDDQDGQLDEDPEEDINGDGIIVMMRQKNEKEGTMVVHPDDPRIMVRPDAENGQRGAYKIWRSEGIDNDEDGEINEDGRGGVNVNRNYPGNWETAEKQSRGGEYPLSETESRAIAQFVIAHPNICIAQSYHTSGGFLYQPLASEKIRAIPEDDQAVFKKLGEAYTTATGNKVRRPYRETGPRPGPYGFGIFLDWAYLHRGIFSGTTELWNMPEKYRPQPEKPGKKDGEEKSEYEKYLETSKNWYTFIDEELGGEGFVPWTPFEHPTLGPVEIGGWAKFVRSNPPVKYLSEIVARNTKADLAFAELTPMVSIFDVEVTLVQAGTGAVEAETEKTGTGFALRKGGKLADRIAILEIKATVQNEGKSPSVSSKMAATRLPAQPGVSDYLILEPMENVTLLTADARMSTGSLAPGGKRGDRKSAAWLIQLTGREGKLKIVSQSEQGGRQERIITLN